MTQDREIYDYAAVGKRLFDDSHLRSKGPIAHFEDRATSIFGRPDHVIQDAVPRESISLIMKWPLGSRPDGSGDVLFDMSSAAPPNWVDELPHAVTAMRYFYRDVGVYLGCIRNATLQQIRHVMHYVIYECVFGFVCLDAAGLIDPLDASGKPNPNWGKIIWIEDICGRAGVEVYYEPVRRLVPLAFTTVIGERSIQEEDHARPRTGLANVIAKPDGRALPPHGRVIAAQQSFNAGHFDARLKEGFALAANFANPEVRSWYLGHLARQEEERRVKYYSAKPGPSES